MKTLPLWTGADTWGGDEAGDGDRPSYMAAGQFKMPGRSKVGFISPRMHQTRFLSSKIEKCSGKGARPSPGWEEDTPFPHSTPSQPQSDSTWPRCAYGASAPGAYIHLPPSHTFWICPCLWMKSAWVTKMIMMNTVTTTAATVISRLIFTLVLMCHLSPSFTDYWVTDVLCIWLETSIRGLLLNPFFLSNSIFVISFVFLTIPYFSFVAPCDQLCRLFISFSANVNILSRIVHKGRVQRADPIRLIWMSQTAELIAHLLQMMEIATCVVVPNLQSAKYVTHATKNEKNQPISKQHLEMATPTKPHNKANQPNCLQSTVGEFISDGSLINYTATEPPYVVYRYVKHDVIHKM